MRIEKADLVGPSCPSCGKEMRQTGYTPTSQSVSYDFICSEDGDCVSWHRRNMNPSPTRQSPAYADFRTFLQD